MPDVGCPGKYRTQTFDTTRFISHHVYDTLDMTNDPIELAVYISTFTVLACFILVAFARLFNLRSIYAAVDYAAAYAALLLGAVLIGTASTVDALDLLLICGTVGLWSLGIGLCAIHQIPRRRKS